MPYTTATGKIYDSGEFAGHLSARAGDRRLGRFQASPAGSQRNRPAARHRPRDLYRGLRQQRTGYRRRCGSKDGNVTVLVGTQSTGQGHHTAYAQIVAEHLGLPPERVRVIQGDTDLIATGAGTGGSSSIPCGGASVAAPRRQLAENLKELAADALEAAAGDLEIADGAVRVAGTDRAVSFAELAGMPATARICCRPKTPSCREAATYPNGTHIAEVEVDPDTGAAQISTMSWSTTSA